MIRPRKINVTLCTITICHLFRSYSIALTILNGKSIMVLRSTMIYYILAIRTPGSLYMHEIQIPGTLRPNMRSMGVVTVKIFPKLGSSSNTTLRSLVDG